MRLPKQLLIASNHKPFYSLSDFYKETYGEKVYKIAIDGGFTCPNRDGSLHSSGCIFCSSSGSGDFASRKSLNMEEKVKQGKQLLVTKTKAEKFIVYFQSYTNTYDTPDNLSTIYNSALIDDSIVGLSIATRPDCIDKDVINVLKELKLKTDVYIELGLQSIHESSATFIRRGYDLPIYDQAVQMLNDAGIPIITHVIIGLPHETRDDIINTVNYITSQNIQGIKLQLLHILTDTDLYKYYLEHPFPILSEADYIQLVVDLIEIIPSDIVIHRLTGDGPKDLLHEPKWSLNKRHVLNGISKKFKELNAYQGRLKEVHND